MTGGEVFCELQQVLGFEMKQVVYHFGGLAFHAADGPSKQLLIAQQVYRNLLIILNKSDADIFKVIHAVAVVTVDHLPFDGDQIAEDVEGLGNIRIHGGPQCLGCVHYRD